MYDLGELLGMHKGALVEEATMFGFGKNRDNGYSIFGRNEISRLNKFGAHNTPTPLFFQKKGTRLGLFFGDVFFCPFSLPL